MFIGYNRTLELVIVRFVFLKKILKKIILQILYSIFEHTPILRLTKLQQDASLSMGISSTINKITTLQYHTNAF
jgi:hypothetical protein